MRNKSKFYYVLSIVILLLGGTIPASADMGMYDTAPKKAFSWYSKGPGCMQLKMLTYQVNPTLAAKPLTFGVKDEKGNKIPCFKISWADWANESRVRANYTNLLPKESEMFLTNDGTGFKTYFSSETLHELKRVDFNWGQGYSELEWFYPVRFAGKSFTFYVEGVISGWTTKYYKEVGTITFDEISFEVYDPLPGTEEADYGMLRLPVATTSPINWIEATYKDGQGKEQKVARQTFNSKTYQTFITVPAAEAHKNLTVKANIRSASWTDAQPGDPEKLDGEVTKTIANVGMVHAPKELTATNLDDYKGSVLLKWKISDMDCPDIFDGDMFIVQRSLTGKDVDYQTIGQEYFDIKKENYEFKDSLIIDAVKPEYLDAQRNLSSLQYRVVRASTIRLWKFDKNPTVATVKPSMNYLRLMTLTNVNATLVNSDQHIVRLTWDYSKSIQQIYPVWDNRAEMILSVLMFNAAGQRVDSIGRSVTDDERKTRSLTLTLPRSCVKYQIWMGVDPKMSPFGNGSERFTVSAPADQFYYQNSGKVIANSLVTYSLQSSVRLEWNTDELPVDYFDVQRRMKGSSQNWELIATKLVNTQYVDATVSPLEDYEYRVRSAADCEGTSYAYTDAKEGHCLHSCRLEGYVRFADGTGVPGVTLVISQTGGSATEHRATTDDAGHYSIDGLPYWNNNSTGSYKVMVTGIAATDLSEDCRDGLGITFDANSNHQQGMNFTVTGSVRFTGYVMYRGTSIPVENVGFLVDGREVRSASGAVTTNYEGAFTFRMLCGDHTIQAVKDGHTFWRKGYYIEGNDETKTLYNFTTNKDQVFFYDDTRIKLIGRVAGGHVQGSLPLGNSLSKNNLGANLKMVMVLEGDNTSRLVFDIQDRTVKQRNETFTHTSHDGKQYQTRVHTTEHRMEITPDVRTDEYEVMLPSVKWKIQQITARGYATLFQTGKTGEVIDLTDSLKLHTDHLTGEWKALNDATIHSVDVSYHARYSRIYRTPLEVTREQIGYDKFSYFGDRIYVAKDLSGDKQEVPLVYQVKKPNWPKERADSMRTVYTFGAPVFNCEREYPIKIAAVEKYYYNNNQSSDTIDVVRIKGGKVTVRNSMIDGNHEDSFMLNDNGEATYFLKAVQQPYLLTGKEALQTVTISLQLGDTYYEAEPLHAYVLNTIKKQGAKDVLNIGKPMLIEILRDPPGSESTATLAKGSVLKNAFDFDWSVKGGLELSFKFGNQVDHYAGLVAITTETGLINNASTAFHVDLNLVFSGSGKEAYSYTMTTNSDISTSSSHKMVGAKGDVYIGTMTNFVVTPGLSVRAIPQRMWDRLKGERAAGRMIEIAGAVVNGDSVHLVRDEVLTIGPKVQSTFTHTQDYLMSQLLPRIEAECKSLMFTGTLADAKKQANETGKPVYLSLRQPTDKNFAVVNTKKKVTPGDSEWEYEYVTETTTAGDGTNYRVILPSNWPASEREDKVAELSQTALWWAELIARNEREKLNATELVKNFSVDGGAEVSYGEEFSSDYSRSGQVKYFWQENATTPSFLVGWLADIISLSFGSKIS